MSYPLIQGRNFNSELYNRALSSAYRIWTRLYDPDYALSREPDVWEKLRRDATITQSVDTRLHLVAGRQWHIEAARDEEEDKKVSSIVGDILKHIRNFTEARYELAQAIFRARSYAYIEGKPETRTFGDGKPRTWWIPYRLRDVDRRRIRYRPEHGVDKEGLETVKVIQEMWSVIRMRYEPFDKADQFVKIVYRNEEARLGYGRGLMDSMYFYWWMKSIVWREGLQGLERWSQGILIGKIDSYREGSTSKTNESVRDDLYSALHEMRSRHVIVVGKEDEIEVKDGGMAGHEMVMNFIKYMDEKLIALILGSTIPFGGGSGGGSYARARVEEATTNSLIQFDRDKLDESLSDDLIGLVWRLNYKNFVDMGCENAQPPKFRTQPEKREDPTAAAAIIAQLAAIGLPLKTEEVYSKIGFSPPSDGDEVFEGKPKEAVEIPGLPI
tara:strand:- start:1207 stop:2529 length:1323 start_codon:yes stop_codon:yes gene_type:complete